MTKHACPECDEAACVCITVHTLKTWPKYFQALAAGTKTFEARKNDRDYKVGDMLHLQEWCPESKAYTGEEMYFLVTYLMEGGAFGLEQGYVVMGVNRRNPGSRMVAHAREELRRMGYFKEDTDPMNAWMRDGLIDLVRRFSLQGHSGGTAGYAIGTLGRLLEQEPLTPLTGEDDEWEDVSEYGDPTVQWQNKRSSRVLKGPEGDAFDLMARVFLFPDGTTAPDKESRTTIEFPYMPKTEAVRVDEEGKPLE